MTLINGKSDICAMLAASDVFPLPLGPWNSRETFGDLVELLRMPST